MSFLRRLAASVLAVALLTGCGSEQPAGAGKREVVYVTAGTNLPYRAQIADGFQFGAAQVAGVTAKVAGPTAQDPVAQMKVLQDLIRGGAPSISVTLAFLQMTNPDPISGATNTRFIAVDSPPLPDSPIELYVGNDNYTLGRLLADTVADELAAGARTAAGKVVLGSPRSGVPQLDARALGFRERLKERLPGVRVVGPLDTAEGPATAARWASVTRANPDAVAFASVGANAAVLAEVRAKQKGTWLAASFDIDPKALAAVQRGGLVVVSPEHFLKGAVAGRLQAQYAGREAELPAGWVEIPGRVVTRANVDEFIARDASPEKRTAWYTARVEEIIGARVRPLQEAQ